MYIKTGIKRGYQTDKIKTSPMETLTNDKAHNPDIGESLGVAKSSTKTDAYTIKLVTTSELLIDYLKTKHKVV